MLLVPLPSLAQDVTAPVLADTQPLIVAGAGEGSGFVRVVTTDGALVTGAPFGPTFTGGVRVATGDINGDGVVDLVVGSGTGGGSVRVFSGVDAALLLSASPFGAAFTGGVFVAAGDVNGDGRDEIIAGTGFGGGIARVLDGAGGDLGAGYPFGPAYAGGVTVAAGDVNGDGRADVITGTAFGGYVRVFSGGDYRDLGAGFPYGPFFTGGVTVAAGDLDGDGLADLITGPYRGAGAVQVFRVADAHLLRSVTPFSGANGVTVAAGDINGDGRDDLIVGAGPGIAPHVRAMSGVDGSMLVDAFAFEASFRGGVFVSALSRGRVAFSTPAATTFRVGSAGSFAVAITGPAAGVTLSVAGTLPSGVTFTDAGNGTAQLAGTPAAGSEGVHTVQFRATRGTTVVATQDFTLTVERTPAITSTSSATFAEQQAGSFTITTSGFPAATVSVAGVLPSGVTVVNQGNGTALVSGTPAAGAAGTYPLTVTATNAAGSATQNFTLIVNSATPLFTSAAAATFRVGTPASFTITTSATPTVTSITVAGTLPAGITYADQGDGTATLSGTPAVGSAGTHTLTFTAANGVGVPAQQTFTLTVEQTVAITSAASTTFTVGTAGSFTVTATGSPTPSITLAGALPTGVSFVDNGDGTAGLGGTPTSAGVFVLTLTAQNGVGSPATQTFTLTVHGPPFFTSPAVTTLVAGAAGSFNVTTSGTPAVTSLTLTSGTLPAGVTFTPGGATGVLAGTPAAGTGGSYPLVFSATNGIGAPVTQNFTLIVNQPPAFTSAASTTFNTGVAETFTVSATGFPVVTLTVGGTLPSGITFADNGNGTATLSGTAAAGTAGDYPLTLTATNGVGAAAVQNFTLAVRSVSFTSSNSATFTAGQANSFTVTTQATPAVISITRTGDALPAGVTFVDNLDGTATLAGTPTAGGTFSFTFTADNGTGTATQTFTLTVRQAPAITSATVAVFTAGTAGSFSVTTAGFPTPAITMTGALPAGVTFADHGNGTATLSGTPSIGSGGSYALTITAANGVGTDATQNFTLTINQAPAITSAANTSFTVGTAGSFTVTTTGYPIVTLALTGSLPGGVTFADNGNGTGTLSGTPAAGTGGTYAITFTAGNGIGSDAVQTFTLTVRESAAITSANAVTFVAGTGSSFTVTTTGFPTPALSQSGTLPDGVSFTDNGNGTATLSGTAAAGTGGTYAISISADNGVATAATQNFTLTINQAPAITSSAAATFTAGAANSFTVTTTGVPTPSVTRGGVALPNGVTFTDNGNGTGTLAGTPALGTGGSYAITFTAANGVGSNAVQNFTLEVRQAPAITSANSATFTVGGVSSFTVTASGFPTPTLSQSGALPAGVSFTPASGVLGGTPTQTGVFNGVQFTATNGVGADAVQAFTLTVSCPAITVSATSLPDGLYNTSYGPITFSQTGATGSSFTWSATGLPAGLTIGAANGQVSGTPSTTVLNASVTVTVTDNFGCQGSRNLTVTVRPNPDAETYSNGVGNTQFVVGATAPSTPHVYVADTVLNGDQGPGTLSAGPAVIASANSGAVAMATNGTFTYTPAVGFAGASDSFTYTLTDGNGITNTATVTVNKSGMVWYVNNSGANGDGRSHSPFNTLANAAGPSQANSVIFVHTGSGSTTGSLAMDSNQTLHGQGVLFTLNGLTIAAGTRPTLSGTVTLANNTLVTGLNFSGASPAMAASGSFSLPAAIDQVGVSGGTSALSLTNLNATGTGAVNVSNATFTNTTGAELAISGGNIPVTIASTVSISSNAGRSIDIQSRSGGTVSINGPVVDTGQGVFLNGNTGSTIAFAGGLSLNTGTNPAFTATGGGTVSATQNNTTIVNTVTTTTGAAINVQATTIAAAGLTFRSATTNGAANAIVLSNTGASGGLTISGNGGVCTLASPASCSGGRLLNSSGVAVQLSNTHAPSFDRINIASGGADGMTLTSTTGGFSLTNAVLSTNGNAVGYNTVGEKNLELTNVSGTGTITSTVFNAGYGGNVGINNSGSAAMTLNISNATIQNSVGDATAISSCSAGCEGIGAELLGTTNTTLSVQNSTFAGNAGNNIEVRVKQNAVLNATINGNALSGQNNANASVLGGGVFLSGLGDVTLGSTFEGSISYAITNNSFDRMHISAIGVNLSPLYFNGTTWFQGTGDASGTISGNAIGTAGVQHSGSVTGHGIVLDSRGGAGSVHTALITNNQIHGYNNSNGINVTVGETNSASATNMTITTNTLSTPGTFTTNGVHLNSGTTGSSADQVCVAISGNTMAGSGVGPTNTDFRLRQRQQTTVRLPGYSGAAGDTAAVVAFVQGNNPGAETGSAAVNFPTGGGGFVGGAACPTP